MEATRVRRLRIRKAIGRTTFAFCMLATGALYAGLGGGVTFAVDGPPPSARTASGSVGQVLAGSTQVGSPALTGVGVWVMEGVSRSLLKVAAEPTESWLSAGSSAGSSRIVEARVVVRGKEHDVLTNAATIRELLSAMGITPDRDDGVRPSPSTPLQSASLIRYTEIEVRTRRTQVVVPFDTITVHSPDLAPGDAEVLRPGVPGSVIRTIRTRLVDGEVVAQTVLSENVVVDPVAAKKVVGPLNGTSGSAVGEAVWYEAPGAALTAAHLTLPFGARVTVTNLDNGKSVAVVINDRGPYGGRLIDLSPEAFSAIAPLGQGVARVRITW